MQLNILKPKDAVASAFEKPNLLIALVLVLLPAIVSILGRIPFGATVDASGAAEGIILTYVRFFELAIIIFVLAMIVNREKAKGMFLGTLAGLSLAQIVSLVVVILSFIALPIVFSQEAIDVGVQAGKSANMERTVYQIVEFLEENPDAVNLGALYAFMAITIALVLWGIYIQYHVVRKLTESRVLVVLLLLAITYILTGVLPP